MARKDVGKWVARAGATGGGRTYRGSTPVNWYLVLTVIITLGVLSVLYAGYQYRHPPAAASAGTPTTSTTWHAGLEITICGKHHGVLPTDQKTSTKTQSFYTKGTGIITIAPKNSKSSGSNATFGKFISGYPGLSLSTKQIKLPTGSKSVTYNNGEKCPSGTKDAGKTGQVLTDVWTNFETNKAGKAFSGNPSSLKFTNNQFITVGFDPSGTKFTKTGTVESAELKDLSTTTTTTTPSVPTTPTTAKSPSKKPKKKS